MSDEEAKKYVVERAARFVSLIPSKTDNSRFRDVPEAFLTCQQFIDIKGGDMEERACLLCNYFIFLDQHASNQSEIKNYVLLGHAGNA